MISITRISKRLILILTLCIAQRFSLQENVSADKLETSEAIIAISKNYNNLIDVFRKNWESPLGYLIQRGYIPLNEAKPDKKSREAIKKMQKEYGHLHKKKKMPPGQKKAEASNFFFGKDFDKNSFAMRKSKMFRRRATKPTSTTKSPRQADDFEMKCVKWEPKQVSTTTCKPTTTTCKPTTTTCKPTTTTCKPTTTTTCKPTTTTCKPTTTTCKPTTTTTVCSTTVCSSSSVKPNCTSDICEEYYDDVTECYEYEVFDNMTSDSRVGNPTITSTTVSNKTTSTPNSVAPKISPNYTTASLVENDENNENEVNSQSKNSKDSINSDAYKMAEMIAQNTVKECLKNFPKKRKEEKSGMKSENRFKRKPENNLNGYTRPFSAEHVPNWGLYPSLSLQSSNLLNGKAIHTDNHSPNIDESIAHISPQDFFYENLKNPNTARGQNKNIKSKEKEKMKSGGYNFYKGNDPNSDLEDVSLNAVYVVNDQIEKNWGSENSEQHFDNVDEQQKVQSLNHQLSVSRDNSPPSSIAKNIVGEFKFPQNIQPLKPQNNFIGSKNALQQFGLKEDLASPSNELYDPKNYKPDSFLNNLGVNSFSTYNTPTNLDYLSKLNQDDSYLKSNIKPYEDNSIRISPALPELKTTDVFWPNVQQSDKKSNINVNQLHKPDFLTYPHNEFLNNVESYPLFDSEPSILQITPTLSDKKKDYGSDINTDSRSKELAKTAVEMAVRNVINTT